MATRGATCWGITLLFTVAVSWATLGDHGVLPDEPPASDSTANDGKIAMPILNIQGGFESPASMERPPSFETSVRGNGGNQHEADFRQEHEAAIPAELETTPLPQVENVHGTAVPEPTAPTSPAATDQPAVPSASPSQSGVDNSEAAGRVSNVDCYQCSNQEDCQQGGVLTDCKMRKANGCATVFLVENGTKSLAEKVCSEWAFANACEYDRDVGPGRRLICHCKGNGCNAGNTTRSLQQRSDPKGPDKTRCYMCTAPFECQMGGIRDRPCNNTHYHSCLTIFHDPAARDVVIQSMTFVPEPRGNKWNHTEDGPFLPTITFKGCSNREVPEDHPVCEPIDHSDARGELVCYCNTNNCNDYACTWPQICNVPTKMTDAASSPGITFSTVINAVFLSAIQMTQ